MQQPTDPARDDVRDKVRQRVWSGRWVAERLGVRITTTASAPGGPDVEALAGLALRRNPRRAHLLVSPVLGKHVPADPRVVLAAGASLGALVRAVLPGASPATLVIGYAETATALGHTVAASLGATYLHSTRRRADGREEVGFEEAHSHASSHRLLPDDPGLLERACVVVLVDDELSTGATAIATVRALQRQTARPTYVVAALLDLRTPTDRDRFDEVARELGTTIRTVALAAGDIELGPDVLARGQRLVAEVEAGASTAHPVATAPVDVRRVTDAWPHGPVEGGRHGFGPTDETAFAAGVEQLAAAVVGEVVDDVTSPGSLHVLGHEELMYLPLRLAERLGELLPQTQVTFSSTTRSPVVAVDDPGYAIRTVITFPSHDDPEDGPGPRYAYNLVGAGIDVVVLCVDESADTADLLAPGGLLDRLGDVAPRVLVVSVPEAGRRGSAGDATSAP